MKNIIFLPISSLVFASFFCRFIRETLTTNKINLFEQNSKVLNPLCSDFLIPYFHFSLRVCSSWEKLFPDQTKNYIKKFLSNANLVLPDFNSNPIIFETSFSQRERWKRVRKREWVSKENNKNFNESAFIIIMCCYQLFKTRW